MTYRANRARLSVLPDRWVGIARLPSLGDRPTSPIRTPTARIARIRKAILRQSIIRIGEDNPTVHNIMKMSSTRRTRPATLEVHDDMGFRFSTYKPDT